MQLWCSGFGREKFNTTLSNRIFDNAIDEFSPERPTKFHFNWKYILCKFLYAYMRRSFVGVTGAASSKTSPGGTFSCQWVGHLIFIQLYNKRLFYLNKPSEFSHTDDTRPPAFIHKQRQQWQQLNVRHDNAALVMSILYREEQNGNLSSHLFELLVKSI